MNIEQLKHDINFAIEISDFDTAITLSKELAKQTPNDSSIYTLMSDLYLKMFDISSSISCLKKAALITKGSVPNINYQLNNELFCKGLLSLIDSNKIEYDLEFLAKMRNDIKKDDYRYLKSENSYKHKHSYFDEHIANKRGYDFISLVPKYKTCLTEVSDWDLIKDNSNENATFDKKQIYKGPYDRSDVMKNEMKYRQRRDDYIKQLPNVNDDDMFKPRIKLCKKNIQLNNNDNLMNVGKSVVLDKRKWFGDKKSYLIDEFDLNVINSNDDVGLRGQIMSNRLTGNKMKKREFSSHF